jgi:hypothetical protein
MGRTNGAKGNKQKEKSNKENDIGLIEKQPVPVSSVQGMIGKGLSVFTSIGMLASSSSSSSSSSGGADAAHVSQRRS